MEPCRSAAGMINATVVAKMNLPKSIRYSPVIRLVENATRLKPMMKKIVGGRTCEISCLRKRSHARQQ